MRPRQIRRGVLVGERVLVPGVGASMRPRQIRRGVPGLYACRAHGVWELQ